MRWGKCGARSVEGLILSRNNFKRVLSRDCRHWLVFFDDAWRMCLEVMLRWIAAENKCNKYRFVVVRVGCKGGALWIANV